jgi:hypothetical protein
MGRDVHCFFGVSVFRWNSCPAMRVCAPKGQESAGKLALKTDCEALHALLSAHAKPARGVIISYVQHKG